MSLPCLKRRQNLWHYSRNSTYQNTPKLCWIFSIPPSCPTAIPVSSLTIGTENTQLWWAAALGAAARSSKIRKWKQRKIYAALISKCATTSVTVCWTTESGVLVLEASNSVNEKTEELKALWNEAPILKLPRSVFILKMSRTGAGWILWDRSN